MTADTTPAAPTEAELRAEVERLRSGAFGHYGNGNETFLRLRDSLPGASTVEILIACGHVRRALKDRPS